MSKKGLSKMDRKIIERRAERVLDAFEYDPSDCIYVDAVMLARFFGFNVIESDSLPEHDDGNITVSADGKEKTIVVNTNRNFETKRFIITHELSHYLLHYTGDQTLFRHRENIKGKNEEENDADFMAACLLMPRKSFSACYKVLRQTMSYSDMVVELQLVFKATSESVIRRISEIKQRRVTYGQP